MLTSEYVADFRAYERSLQTGPQDERVAHCVNRLMDVLFPLILELRPTRDEWNDMIEWVSALGPVHTKLVLWLIGLTQLVEEGNANLLPEATQVGVEGPFFVPGAPVKAHGEPLAVNPEAENDWLILDGTVTDLKGRPLGDVEMHVWAANSKGTYSNFDQDAEPWDCRGRVRTDPEGRYVVRLPMPASYSIHGPGAQLLTALGRQLVRPKHVHFLINHSGYEELIMQVCFEGDPYARIDSALAVKEEHIIPVRLVSDAKTLSLHGLSKPFHHGTYGFRLQPSAAAQAA